MPPPAPKTDKKERGAAEDFAAAFQTQSLYLFPLMIGFFSWTLPIGLSLYWNTFSIFGIIQQRQLDKAHKTTIPAVKSTPVIESPKASKKKKGSKKK